MVLGLLTVMVLMAVTFAISMRTERLAAGNYADTVRARELVQVGLARAMDDLAVKLGTNGLMSPAGGTNYPPWNATNSYINTDGIGTARFPTNIYLLRGEATNYVPRALWDVATNADWLNPSNHWLPVESLIYDDADVLVESNLMGRVAYLILNCSGLLDANYAGGAAGTAGGIIRAGSSNPADIAIANLEEISGQESFFLDARTDNIRYETLAQLNAMGDFRHEPATNLFVYSRALPGYWSNNVIPSLSQVVTQVNLSGTATNIYDRRVQITDALINVGISSPDAFVIWRNLMDYVDTNDVPEIMTTSVEPVPMINEMVFSNTVVYSAGPPAVWNVNCGVSFELWYPFVSGGGTYSFTANVAFVSSAGAGTLLVGNQLNNRTLSPMQPFDVINFNASSNYSVNPVSFNVQVNAARVMSGANVLDELQCPYTIISGMTPGVVGWECLDPRFNHYPNNPDSWRQASLITLSAVNDWTLSYLASTNDGDTAMYVANRPLQSVAELGYLVYSSNAPWHTVKLYGTNLHRVLDVFGLSTNTSDILMTNTVYRGLVNCNTNIASNATAVVFAGMRVDKYPGDPSYANMTMDDARTFISRMYAGGICTNLSDIGRNLNLGDFQVPAVGITELEREAYFRNAFNLLNLRQNMFTIIIEAQAASGGNIPRNPAKQRAVAIVWRDPYTGEMFVRHIKWLGD